MFSEYTYVHLDSVTNAVLSTGITQIFDNYTSNNLPKNILLLEFSEGIGELDPHTGFRIIRGTANVKQYLDRLFKGEKIPAKWIDFESLDLLRELTPVEISELLYIAHAYTHLYSPFYYKLQNNFIYLTMGDNFKKVYYRKLEQFYSLLANHLTENLEKKVNGKKTIFQKPKKIEPLSYKTTLNLIPMLKEGIVFSFKQMTCEKEIYSIPIYLVEDRLRAIHDHFDDKDLLGNICYDASQKEWYLNSEKSLQPSL